MKRTPVSSSNVDSVGYDGGQRILEVEFNRGGIYQYFNVPHDIYKGLMEAMSVGSYFAENVKGKFEFSKVKA